MIIIGAGYAGLLAGCIFRKCEIHEALSEEECKIKHQAVFRMATDKISEYTGIEFKKVRVFKGIWHKGEFVQPSIMMMHLYSKKVSSIYGNRSIANIDSEIRFIPPDDFYDRLKEQSSKITFRNELNPFDCDRSKIISTIPLPTILRLKKDDPMKYSDQFKKFKRKEIFVNHYTIKDCDSYSTIYYPDHETSVYRATLNGNSLVVESLSKLEPMYQLHNCEDPQITEVINSFGISNKDVIGNTVINHRQSFGKITEIDNNVRKKILFELTAKHRIYSLGRYATWRPKIMLDGVFDDIFVIKKLMKHGDYASFLYYKNEEVK